MVRQDLVRVQDRRRRDRGIRSIPDQMLDLQLATQSVDLKLSLD